MFVLDYGGFNTIYEQTIGALIMSVLENSEAQDL